MRFAGCLLRFYFCLLIFHSTIWLVELPYSQNRNRSWFALKYSISWLQCFGILIVVLVQLLSHVRLFATSWTTARQASLSITNSWSLLKRLYIESVMPSSPLILCHPLLLLPSVFPSIRFFSSKSALRIRWPKYQSFSISPSNEYSGLISFRIDWFDLAIQRTLKNLLQHHNSKASVLQCSAFLFCNIPSPF